MQQLYTAMENLQFMQQLSLMDAGCRQCTESSQALAVSRSELQREREQLLVQEKVIEDQARSINALKINVRQQSQDNLYVQLQSERQLKRRLLSEIEVPKLLYFIIVIYKQLARTKQSSRKCRRKFKFWRRKI